MGGLHKRVRLGTFIPCHSARSGPAQAAGCLSRHVIQIEIGAGIHSESLGSGF
jgi:hypothetical protein